MRKLIANKWQTPDGTILWSKYTYDYVCHLDKNGEYYFIDGGNDYIRKSVNKEHAINLCVYDDGKFETLRENTQWGRNYDANNKRLPETEWITIKDLTTDHLYGILKYFDNEFNSYDSVFRIIEEEIIYRENKIR